MCVCPPRQKALGKKTNDKCRACFVGVLGDSGYLRKFDGRVIDEQSIVDEQSIAGPGRRRRRRRRRGVRARYAYGKLKNLQRRNRFNLIFFTTVVLVVDCVCQLS